MEYRTLGRTGLRVSEVGFGAMTIGGEVFGATDDAESLRVLHRAIDAGISFIDTADSYGQGHSESLIAEVLKTRRDDVVLATKGGNHFIVKPGSRNFDPDYIESALERSLKRLGIEAVDLYQLHNPTPEIMRSGEIFDRLDRLKVQGKLRFYGVSLERPDHGLAAIETGKPDTLQLVYNILHQEAEEQLFPLAERDNVGIIVRVPLERGVLSGNVKSASEWSEGDFRARTFGQEGLDQVNEAVGKLGFLVQGDVPNLAQAALRFVLSHPSVSSVIPGIRTEAHVEDNVAASGKPLSADVLAKLRDLYRSDFQGLPFH